MPEKNTHLKYISRDEFGLLRSPEVAIFYLICSGYDTYTKLREITEGHITYETLSKSLDIIFDLDAISTYTGEDGTKIFEITSRAKNVADEILREEPSAWEFYKTVNTRINMLREPIHIDNDPMEEPCDFLKGLSD